MKLKRREKILLGLAGGLVVLMGLWFLLFGGDSRTDEQLIAERTARTTELEDKKKQVKVAERDEKSLAEWQRCSLPSETTRARMLYQGWLRKLMTSAGFRESQLTSTDSSTHKDSFTITKFTVTLHAQAKLGDLVQFLYQFYAVGYLHQIRRLDLKPNKNSTVNVDMTIEALSLSTAASKTDLPKDVGHVLQLKKASDYDPIAKRDFFAAYRAQRRIPRGVDPADFTFVTGFTAVNGAPKVWVRNRMTDKGWQLGTGETFDIGDVKAKVETVHPEGEVIIDFDGHRRRLRDGDNLRGGVEIQEPPLSKAEDGDNSGGDEPDEGN